jgi:hypothetical protein
MHRGACVPSLSRASLMPLPERDTSGGPLHFSAQYEVHELFREIHKKQPCFNSIVTVIISPLLLLARHRIRFEEGTGLLST